MYLYNMVSWPRSTSSAVYGTHIILRLAAGVGDYHPYPTRGVGNYRYYIVIIMIVVRKYIYTRYSDVRARGISLISGLLYTHQNDTLTKIYFHLYNNIMRVYRALEAGVGRYTKHTFVMMSVIDFRTARPAPGYTYTRINIVAVTAKFARRNPRNVPPTGSPIFWHVSPR